MTITPLSVAIVGATGVVGQECLRLLEQRRFPVGTLKLLASSRSAGTATRFQGRDVVIEELGPASLSGVDVAFFAADAEQSRAMAPHARAAGCLMIDKSSAFRGDPGVPLVIPEVNPEALESLPSATCPGLTRSGLVAVPNCSTIILLVALEPIRRALGVERVVVSTYQAASGAGAAAMDELRDQTAAVLRGEPATPRVFKEPCAFNVFSHDSSMDAATGLNAEEAKFTSETRRIWGDPGVKINATCVRVPVMRGHSESVCLTLKRPASEREVRSLLERAAGVRVVDDRAGNRFPTPLHATHGDDVLVGRIRPDATQPSETRGGETLHHGFNLFIAGDQVRVGAALTAVRIAERLIGA